MTKLTSPSAEKRQGNPFNTAFEKYLDHLIEVDPDIQAVCIKLDEEGNEYWELDPQETTQLIEKLRSAVKALKTKK